jgi:hypothetical protein
VDFSEARDLFVIIFQILGSDCKFMDFGLMSKIGFSGNCFPKGKPVDRVHESVDHADPVYRGPAAIAALRSSLELGLQPLRCPRAPTEGWGEDGRVGEPNCGVVAAWEAVEGRLIGGGSFGSDGRRRGRGEG